VYKINRIYVYVILLIALFIHLTVLDYVKIFGAKPDIMLACVIFFGLFAGAGMGLESGIAAGLMKDLYSLDFFGINTFVFALTGLLAGMLSTNFFRESKRTQGLLVLFFTIFSMTMHYVLVSVFSKWLDLRFSEYLFTSIIPAGIYTSLVAVPIFSRFIAMYDPREIEELL